MPPTDSAPHGAADSAAPHFAAGDSPTTAATDSSTGTVVSAAPCSATVVSGTRPSDADTDGVDADGGDPEDTLDLHLPPEFLALRAMEDAADTAVPLAHGDRRDQVTDGDRRDRVTDGDRRDQVTDGDLRDRLTGGDLLDHLADWGPAATAAGEFRLLPVRLDRDLPLISRWMNDPAVAAFWELAGPAEVTEAHLAAQLGGDGRSVPCLGVLDGTPMSYWELYRADLDPLARHYPARLHDTGIHLLLGGVTDRGRGLGGTLLRAVADLVLDRRPACNRVVAEPDVRNVPSLAAFLAAGFRYSAEVDLPGKRAALMVRDRSLRHLM
ncbi:MULTISPECIES: GNAT family N-acetyltransferase [unclassified Streptomyces]|uniref:GNAT family N-acetyltransferase n=1 Tax=unclassified Streptomyces TaxID=2593676 RepID=UPI0036FCD9CB